MDSCRLCGPSVWYSIFLQHYFFFRPEILPKSFEYRYPFPFDEVDFEMEDGGSINGLHFKVPNAKGVVFYLKGNSRSIKGWGKFAKDFVSKGYDFFMIDYRGFGKSSGRRTETTLYNDAQTVYKWLSTQYPEEEIIIYGRSLGSGIAARIASWNKTPHAYPGFSILQLLTPDQAICLHSATEMVVAL